MRWIDPPVTPSNLLFRELAGKTDVIRLIYEIIMGDGAGKGLGWAPMLCEIARRAGAGQDRKKSAERGARR